MTEVVQLSDSELDQQLPRPVGYRVLVALPEIEKTYADTSVLKIRTKNGFLMAHGVKKVTLSCFGQTVEHDLR
jgi:hypothetical protein